MVGGFFDISEAGAKRVLIKPPRIRIAFFLILLCVAASLRNYEWLGMIAILVFGLCLWAGIKWTYVFLRMVFLLPFGLGAILLLPFVVEGQQKQLFWGISVSIEGMSTALLLICKLFLCHFIICLILSTTSPTELFNTLYKLGVPFILVEIMKITFRYLAVLFDEIERMIIAQQSRGFSFKIFSTWSAYKRSGELLGVLMIRSYHRSKRIHEAKISRGFDSNTR